ncbi:MAG: tetratricopeptide repeat protein, partial [Prevotellaceae bacterium]|nr:tetratricopeptide repeat protein [Prevotellaceae bacterium]
MKKIIFKTIYIFLLLLCSNQVRSEVSLKLSPIVYDAIDLYNNEQYVKALDKFIAGIEAAEAEKDSISYMACYLYIGNIYSCFSDFNGSIYYFLNGYNLAVKYNNRYIQGVLLSNIVGTYCRMGNPTKAKEYYEKEKKVHSDDKYYLLYNKARILQAENKLEEALKMHMETLAFATKKNMGEQEKLIQLSEIGNVLVKLERYDEAIKYGDECMRSSIKLKNNDLLINAYHILADAYRGKGNIDNSIKYQNLLFSISDTVFNAKRFYAARNNLKEYEDRVVGREMTSLNSVIMRQSNIITWISIFSILIMSAAIIIYLQYRKLR